MFLSFVAHDVECDLVATRGWEWDVAQIDDRGNDQLFPWICPYYIRELERGHQSDELFSVFVLNEGAKFLRRPDDVLWRLNEHGNHDS